MLFKIVFDPLLALTMMELLVNQYIDKLTVLNFTELYGKTGLVVQDQLLTKIEDKQTFNVAAEICRANRSTMFTVYPFHDLTNIMTTFGIDRVWTNVFKSKAGTLMDVSGMYPVSETEQQMIQQNDMTSYVDTTHKIVLAKSNDVFSYEPELITTLTNALCFKQLDFPFREKDPEVFAETIGTFVSGVTEQKKELAKTKKQIKMKINILDRITLNKTKFIDDEIDRKTDFEAELSKIQALADRIPIDFQNMNTQLDTSNIITRHLTILEKLDDLLQFVTMTIDNPLEIDDIISSIYVWPEDQRAEKRLYLYNKTMFYLLINKDKNEIPPYTGFGSSLSGLINTEHFWELTLPDLILIGADWLLTGLMAIVYKIGKRLRVNYDKLTRPKKTFNVRQIQSRPMERTQSSSVIREQRIEPCGACADRRRKAIDLPTTMPKNKPKSRAPTSIPLWRADSNLSL